jgi:hypothetical protein
VLDAIDEPAHRDPLAGAEREGIVELGRDLEGDRYGSATSATASEWNEVPVTTP